MGFFFSAKPARQSEALGMKRSAPVLGSLEAVTCGEGGGNAGGLHMWACGCVYSVPFVDACRLQRFVESGRKAKREIKAA